MKYSQLVIGPAGCGKSTYCGLVQEYLETIRKHCHIVNLDPAADAFQYTCSIDVRDLIRVDDVMEEMHYGPNGALVFAMEYLLENSEWLEEQLNDFGDDDYVIFDCPGQIELYTHNPVMRELTLFLGRLDFRIAAVYCIDVSFLNDVSKFISGSLSALSAMIQLELPHINLLTKCDLTPPGGEEEVEKWLEMSPTDLSVELSSSLPVRYRALNCALIDLLEEYSLVSYLTLNQQEEESIGNVIAAIDMIIQRGEAEEAECKFDLPTE